MPKLGQCDGVVVHHCVGTRKESRVKIAVDFKVTPSSATDSKLQVRPNEEFETISQAKRREKPKDLSRVDVVSAICHDNDDDESTPHSKNTNVVRYYLAS